MIGQDKPPLLVRLAIAIPILLFCVYQLWQFTTIEPSWPYYFLVVGVIAAVIYIRARRRGPLFLWIDRNLWR